MATIDKTETMQGQEEQGSPKALTEITAREPNTDNFTYVTSGDGHQVPVPKGYVASPIEAEKYRDGQYVTWKKQEDLTFKSATTYYLDQTLTLASPEGEEHPWTQNATAGAWQSGNYQVASSTSTIETNEFTVANNGDVVRIVWSVSSQNTANTDYAYYTIINTATSETIGGTSTGIYGTGNGTEEASLIFNNTDVALNAGTYKVEVKYVKDAETDTDLDRAYVKSINVYSTNASSSNASIEIGSANDYAWSYDSSLGAWKSGNYNISNSTSTIESNNFTVTEATKVRISWAVCSQATNDYVYYTITNVDTGATTGGTSTKKSGTGNGTAEASLTYTNTDVNLSEGTYKVELKYVKDYTTNTNLDRAYLKSISVCTQSATGEAISTVRVGSGGFVIYEKNAGETDEQATETIAENLNTEKINRNQWVWVPISSNEVKNMYHVSNGQLYGNSYYFRQSGYTKYANYSAEPALVSYDNDQAYLKIFLVGISQNEFLQEMRERFYNMLESIATYGGFYIGRYETGNINLKIPVVRKGNSNISNQTWYTMYRKCQNLQGTNKTVQTGMIWGIQWDETVKWLIDSGEKTSAELNNRRGSWGQLPNNGRIATGSNENYKANNVFDLLGNCAEWTMQIGGLGVEQTGFTGSGQKNTRILRGAYIWGGWDIGCVYEGYSVETNFSSENSSRPTISGGQKGTRCYMIIM